MQSFSFSYLLFFIMFFSFCRFDNAKVDSFPPVRKQFVRNLRKSFGHDMENKTKVGKRGGRLSERVTEGQRKESVRSLISICGDMRSYNILYTASRIGMFTCMWRLISFMHFVPKKPSAIISISICADFTE